MWKSRNNRVGISLGDPCGIGPEIIAKSLSQLTPHQQRRFLLIGDSAVLGRYTKTAMIKEDQWIDLGAMPKKSLTPGKPNPASARAALAYLNQGIELIKSEKISALVTAPVCKEAIGKLGIPFQGHTEFLAESFQVKKFGMLFVTDRLKTMVLTRHIPLHQVSASIRSRDVWEAIMLLTDSLRKYFHQKNPRIAVCGLNPHAGEGGTIGTEELTRIIPAIERARNAGVSVTGPWPADTLFIPSRLNQFDAVLAMYHDQGLIPIKALYFSQVVNLTIGLPFVRTSPAHGTAFDIAGKNKADPSSMKSAMKLALQLTS